MLCSSIPSTYPAGYGGKERRVKVDLLLLDVSNESKMLNTYM